MQTKTYRRTADHPIRAWHESGQFREGYTFEGFVSAYHKDRGGVVEIDPPTGWQVHRSEHVEEVS